MRKLLFLPVLNIGIKKYTRVIFIILISCLVFISTNSCNCKIDKKTVKIGVLFPFSGPAESTGTLAKEAVTLAVEDINKKGGVAGYRLEALFADDKSKPEYAGRLAEKLVTEDKVDFLIGGLTSDVAIKITEISRRYKKIFVGCSHAASSLIMEHFHPYYFRIRRSSFQSMAAGALFLKELQKTKPWRSISFIGPDYSFSYDAIEELRYNLKRFGVEYKLTSSYWPKLFTKDYKPFITSIIRDKPDVLVMGLISADLSEFVKQGSTNDLFSKMTVCSFEAGEVYNFLRLMQDDIPLHIFFSASYIPNWSETEENRNFVAMVKRSSGRYPSVVEHNFYHAVAFIARAIEKVGNPHDTHALIKAMEEMKIKLPGDPENFTSYIHPETHQIVQTVAVGQVLENKDFPPATRMLGNWKVFKAEDLMPPLDYIKARREKFSNAAGNSKKNRD